VSNDTDDLDRAVAQERERVERMKHRVVSVGDARNATRWLRVVQHAVTEVAPHLTTQTINAIAEEAMRYATEEGLVLSAQVGSR
jgi:truncated hemoglobin YjbI